MGSRKEKVVFAVMLIVYMILFFLIFRWIWDTFVPWKPPITDLLSMILLVLIGVPVTGITANWTTHKLFDNK
ncbi:hypothetical protein [Paenibacillus sp. GCM10028914]|uniref:hypothetical protein n=1 Tax=Paenibacillus sp. GCM10028914 TaxID=3273416 RepID=UPI003608F07F